MPLKFLGNHENNLYGNSCQELVDHRILQGFWSEFWWTALLYNNSDDIKFLRVRWSQNS